MLSLLTTLLLLIQACRPHSVAPSVITYAPVPSAAKGPAVPASKGYRVHSFGLGAYMITDGTYQSLFFVAEDSVVALDAPPSIGKNLLPAIRSVTSKPISHIIYSHSHADHIGAAFLLQTSSDVVIVAHSLTAGALKMLPDPHRPVPDITFDKEYDLYVSNQTLKLSYGGNNHEPGNIMAYAPAQKILVFIDIVFPGWIPPFGLGEAESVPGYIAAHDQILEYDFDHYIGGHVDRSGTREDVLVNREWVHDVFDSCVEAWKLSGLPSNATNPVSGAVLEPLAEKANPGNAWAVADTVFSALAEYSYNVTTSKWRGKLGGLDVYGLANANAMVESVFVDWGYLGAFGNINSS